jgi:hypothetical protein
MQIIILSKAIVQLAPLGNDVRHLQRRVFAINHQHPSARETPSLKLQAPQE